MFRKNKQIFIIIIISIYVVGIMISFTNIVLQHVQTIHQENQLSKNKNIETISFLVNDWNNLISTKEIKLNNHYYDVISYQQKDKFIIAYVVKDTFENEIRLHFIKLFKKQQNPFSDKRTTKSLTKLLISENISSFCFQKHYQIEITQNFNNFFNTKTKNYIIVLENPPC